MRIWRMYMRREHNDFCAQIQVRKKQKIEKQKRRRRVLFACVPFVFCLGLFAYAGLSGRLTEMPPVTEGGGLNGTEAVSAEENYPESERAPESAEDADEDAANAVLDAFLQDPQGGRFTVLTVEGGGSNSVTLGEREDVEVLLDFMMQNSEEFEITYLASSPGAPTESEQATEEWSECEQTSMDYYQPDFTEEITEEVVEQVTETENGDETVTEEETDLKGGETPEKSTEEATEGEEKIPGAEAETEIAGESSPEPIRYVILITDSNGNSVTYVLEGEQNQALVRSFAALLEELGK